MFVPLLEIELEILTLSSVYVSASKQSNECCSASRLLSTSLNRIFARGCYHEQTIYLEALFLTLNKAANICPIEVILEVFFRIKHLNRQS